MKAITLFLIASCSAFIIHAQDSEFTVFNNGLIYNEKTMTKLKRISDSLNLSFRTCDFNKTFYAKNQVIGKHLMMSKGNLAGLVRDLENNIPPEVLIKKYPDVLISEELIMLDRDKDEKGKESVIISHFQASGYGDRITIPDQTARKGFKGKWIYNLSEKTSYSPASVTAYYFTEEFHARPLSKKYSSMVGYADCMIDTTTTVFKKEIERGRVELPGNWMALPATKKLHLLEQMRSTRVVGSCSMDESPRIHAINIALLSAETQYWQVFLKSHLDIMNDRFDRASDGSYAWKGRQTYIRELGELNINVSDLLLGVTFRIENPAKHHYYGSVRRLGRALSATQHKAEIEKEMLSIISDDQLDYYNRILFAYLFINYYDYLSNESEKKLNKEKLVAAIQSLPAAIRRKIEPNL